MVKKILLLFLLILNYSFEKAQGFSVDMDTVRAFHALNKDRKEAYLLMKFSDDGKKVIFEKGPAKKKATGKTSYAEKSSFC